jgi:hypothetical protein
VGKRQKGNVPVHENENFEQQICHSMANGLELQKLQLFANHGLQSKIIRHRKYQFMTD